MFDDRGRAIAEAGPSTPVEILGLEGMPDAGDTFLVVADRDKAKGIAQYRKMKEREAQLAKSSRVSLEGLAEQIKQAGMKDLQLILKGDVQGSVEVLADSLPAHVDREGTRQGPALRRRRHHRERRAARLRFERHHHRLQRAARAQGRRARRAGEAWRSACTRSSTSCRTRSRKAMLGLLEPIFKENYLGRAEVLNVFKIPKVGHDRRLPRHRRRDPARFRGPGAARRRAVFKGKIGSLKRFKDDVSEVRNGMECGIGSPASTTSRSATSSKPSPPKRLRPTSVRRWSILLLARYRRRNSRRCRNRIYRWRAVRHAIFLASVCVSVANSPVA